MAEQSGVGASDAGLHMRWPSRVTLSLSVTVLSVLLFVILIRGQWLNLYSPEHVAQSSRVFARSRKAVPCVSPPCSVGDVDSPFVTSHLRCAVPLRLCLLAASRHKKSVSPVSNGRNVLVRAPRGGEADCD